MSANIAELKKGGGSGAKKKYPRLTEGTHLGRVHQVVMLGIQENQKFESTEVEEKDRVLISFEIPGERITGETEEGEKFDKPKVISKEFNVSMHEKAGLFKLVSAIAPKAASLGDMINTPCMIQVGSTATGNAKIVSVMAAPAGIEVPALENPAVFYDFDNHDQAEFDTLYNWQQEKVKSAVNWREPAEAEEVEV